MKKWNQNKMKKTSEIMNAKDINTKQRTRWDVHYFHLPYLPIPSHGSRGLGRSSAQGWRATNWAWEAWDPNKTVERTSQLVQRRNPGDVVFGPSATMIHLHLPSQNFVGRSTFGAMSYDQGFSQAGSGSCAKWIQVACCCSRSPRPW